MSRERQRSSMSRERLRTSMSRERLRSSMSRERQRASMSRERLRSSMSREHLKSSMSRERLRSSTYWLFAGITAMLLTVSSGAAQPTGVPGSDPTNARSFLYDMLQNYDPRIPPNFASSYSTNVSCNIFINTIDSISESTMDYLITIFLRQRWSDPRLNYEQYSDEPVLTMDSNMVSEIWVPDLFFTNEKKGHFHDITVPNRFIRIYRNGTIYYSARISLTLSCPMKLHKFPMDTQTCHIQLESFAYTTDRLMFQWDDFTPVEINKELELPQFSLDTYTFSDCTKVYSTGSFTCLQINFLLRREVGYYMIQTYVPSALVVILSWVSFWISVEAVPARISLGVLTILTMTTQSTGIRQSLPRVSYIKAIDVWMSTCLVFVFAALLEFAIVNVLTRKEVRQKVTTKRTNQPKASRTSTEDGISEGDVFLEGKQQTYETDPSGKNKARKVDKYSRRIFPFGFILFNIVYWTSYVLWNHD